MFYSLFLRGQLTLPENYLIKYGELRELFVRLVEIMLNQHPILELSCGFVIVMQYNMNFNFRII